MSIQHLPKDLTKLTHVQQVAVVNHLAKQPLAKLRKFQDINSMQLRVAHRIEDVKNLQVREAFLDAAIMKREFGRR